VYAEVTFSKGPADATGMGLLGVRLGDSLTGQELIRRHVLVQQGNDQAINVTRVFQVPAGSYRLGAWAYSWISWLNITAGPAQPSLLLVEDLGETQAGPGIWGGD
jgi:hypothetical protein